MNVPVSLALRAELTRAQTHRGSERLALFVVGLGDEGDFPAWALASALAPGRFSSGSTQSSCAMVVGAVPLLSLIRTLHHAGERDLSAELCASASDGIPVLLMQDVLRTVTALHDVEALEAEAMLHQQPLGCA